MTYVCPKCQSTRIRSNDYAKKIGAFIGTVAGALSVSSQAGRYTMGAVSRLVIGKFPIPPIGRSAGTIINALVAGTAGGAAGARLGEFIDAHLLNNFQCLECRHKFSESDIVQEEDESLGEAWMYRPFPRHQHEKTNHPYPTSPERSPPLDEFD